MFGNTEQGARFCKPRFLRLVQPDNSRLDRRDSAENIAQRHRRNVQRILIITANDGRTRQDRHDLGSPGRYSQCGHCPAKGRQQFAPADRFIQSLCARFAIIACLV